MRFAIVVLCISVGALGCGGPKYSPVSGKITMDGNPLPNASVTFQPMSSGDNPNPGVGSAAKTDENGNFTLKISGTEDLGAVVGKHRVEINAFDRVKEIDPTSDKWEKKLPKNLVPPKYNNQSTIEFEVPSGGTNNAVFDLKSK